MPRCLAEAERTLSASTDSGCGQVAADRKLGSNSLLDVSWNLRTAGLRILLPPKPSISYYLARLPLIEGDVRLNDGAWPITFYRIAKGWGLLPSAFWKDDFDADGKWLVPEPDNADDIAKRDRIISYQRLRTEPECLCAILISGLASVSLEITSAWKSPPQGRIAFDANLPVKSVHSIPLIGFNFDLSYFEFQNSWGAEWGNNGRGYLPLGYLNRSMTEGWLSPADRQTPPTESGVHSRVREGAVTPLGRQIILEIIDGDKDIVVAWAHLVIRGSAFDVEELFVRPDFRRKGHGTELVKQIKAAVPLSTPLRFWVPWGDHCEHNAASIIGWARKVGLNLAPSGKRWAAFLGTEGDAVESLPSLNWTPGKAKSSLFALDEPELDSHAGTQHCWNGAKETRRAELVEKDYRSSLTIDEQQELAFLQREFGEYQDFIAPLPWE